MADINLVRAHVGHTRLWPKQNSFRYAVYYLDSVVSDPMPKSPSKLFSFDRWNILSIHRKKHGHRSDKSLRSFIDAEIKTGKVTLPKDYSIRLIAHPRLFGYAFNPISYWLILDNKNLTRAVLCEVNNTFGDNHNYLLSHKDGRPIKPNDTLHAEKQLYVSPFNTMEGRYEFWFRYGNDSFRSDIHYFDDKRKVLTTYVEGSLQPLKTRGILAVVVRYPVMTVLVVARIHWQAVKLLFKKVKLTLKRRPKPYESGRTTRSQD